MRQGFRIEANAKGFRREFVAMQSMAKSVEEARKEIADSEEINYPLLVSWLVSAAESRKIMRARKAS